LKVTVELVDRCPMCGSGESEFFKSGRDSWNIVDGQFPFHRCSECGLVYLHERPTAHDLEKCYPPSYGPYAPSSEPFTMSRPARWLLRVLKAPADVLRRRFPDPAERLIASAYIRGTANAVLVDFGCGSPDYLDKARSQGWTTVGVDFSDDVVSRVRSSGHEAYRADDPTWLDIYRGRVAVVRMNHVIEHLPQPVETLASVRQLLADGGRVHAAVPNISGLSSMIFGRSWLALEPRHVALYNPELLEELFQRAGFGSVQIAGETAAKDLVRSGEMAVLHRVDYGQRGLAVTVLNEVLHPIARLGAALGAPSRIHALATT
jgi:SAM-dependent methyltransferase